MNYPEITADTSMEELARIHRDIWDYVVIFGEKPSSIPYISGCALCEYVRRLSEERLYKDDICKYCPAQWPNSLTCDCYGSLFSKFNGAISLKERKELAKQIRDIPFKSEKKDIPARYEITLTLRPDSFSFARSPSGYIEKVILTTNGKETIITGPIMNVKTRSLSPFDA